MIGLVSGAVSSAARVTGHWISLGITVAMMVLVNFFMFHTLPQRKDDENRPLVGCVRYGPLICTMVAAPLILLDLCRHALQDTQVWKECDRSCYTALANNVPCPVPACVERYSADQVWKIGDLQFNSSKKCSGIQWADYCETSSSQYKCTEYSSDGCIPDSNENMFHLSTIGVIFTIGFTYLGFAFLMVGVMWNAKIFKVIGNIKAEWQRLRGNEPVKKGTMKKTASSGSKAYAAGV